MARNHILRVLFHIPPHDREEVWEHARKGYAPKKSVYVHRFTQHDESHLRALLCAEDGLSHWTWEFAEDGLKSLGVIKSGATWRYVNNSVEIPDAIQVDEAAQADGRRGE